MAQSNLRKYLWIFAVMAWMWASIFVNNLAVAALAFAAGVLALCVSSLFIDGIVNPEKSKLNAARANSGRCALCSKKQDYLLQQNPDGWIIRSPSGPVELCGECLMKFEAWLVAVRSEGEKAHGTEEKGR